MAKYMGEEKRWDVAVIGGGPAGLAAAAYAARSGASVVLLEKGAVLGGRAASLTQEGAVINLGPHALYRGGEAESVMRELGVSTPGSSLRPNIHWVPGADRGEIVSSASLLVGRILSWPEKRRILRFFLGLRKINASVAAGKSWTDWMSENGLSGRAAGIASALARLTTYVGAADRLDAGTAIAQLQRASVSYVHGGWQTMVDGLAARAREAGAECRTSASVTEVEPADDTDTGWTLRLTDGGTVRARQVIAATQPAQVAALFRRWLPASYSASLKKLDTVFAASLDLHLKRLPRANRLFALGVDEPLYFSVHSHWARLCDNPDHAVVHVMRYDEGNQNDPASVRASLESMLDRLQPGWRDCVIRERYMPHIAVMHGLPSADRRGTAGRPPVDTGIPGVYAAGDWTGPEGLLLDAAMASAREAAKLASQRQRIGVNVS